MSSDMRSVPDLKIKATPFCGQQRSSNGSRK